MLKFEHEHERPVIGFITVETPSSPIDLIGQQLPINQMLRALWCHAFLLRSRDDTDGEAVWEAIRRAVEKLLENELPT